MQTCDFTDKRLLPISFLTSNEFKRIKCYIPHEINKNLRRSEVFYTIEKLIHSLNPFMTEAVMI